MLVEPTPIPGFPGYGALKDGTVWSLWVPRKRETGITWRRRRTSFNTGGYQTVILRRDGRATPRLVHRLILETFVGPCPPGMECRHFPDPTRTNCNLNNLLWGTRLENWADIKSRHGCLPTQCIHGHEMTAENTYTHRGRTYCRACNRASCKRRSRQQRHKNHSTTLHANPKDQP